MGLLSNKKGMASLRKTIQSLPKEDQDRGLDMLQEAERVLVTIGAPSRLGVGLLLGAIGATGGSHRSTGTDRRGGPSISAVSRQPVS